MVEGEHVLIDERLATSKYPNFYGHYIYALTDPCTKEVRYIGRTQKITERYRAHLLSYKAKNPSPTAAWINELLAENKLPNLQIIEKLGFNNLLAGKREYHWINHYRSQGCRLFNVLPPIKT